MKYKYHILSQLNKYKKKNRVRMHMPGHKNGGEFAKLFPVSPMDITELSYSDDLNCPNGAIARAQEDIAEITGAHRAYITTDGSSSGVFAMLYVASKYGRRIIVPRNSHKSVFNACKLFRLEPIVIQGRESGGVLLPPTCERVESVIASDADIAGMLVTSPDYYGNIAPMEDYARLMRKYQRLLLCDGAHGAHLAFGNRTQYCGNFADMWVDGAHKSLPTLTQGACVLVNNPYLTELAEEALSLVRTTSPSYPVMASVEYGYKWCANNMRKLAKIRSVSLSLRETLGLKFYPSADWTKLALDCRAMGLSPVLAEKKLQKKGIYAEMNDGRYLLFYLSPSTPLIDLKLLKSALLSLSNNRALKDTYLGNPPLPAPAGTYGYLYAVSAKSEYIPLEQSEGHICAANVGITPPCLPIVIAGEVITHAAVERLASAGNTFGLTDGMIKVVKK